MKKIIYAILFNFILTLLILSENYNIELSNEFKKLLKLMRTMKN